MIAFAVYGLCALTSIGCAALLLRGYARSRSRLLLWSALCFVGLSISNVALVADQTLAMDLSTVRSLPSLIGVMLLVYGLVWNSDQ
jgi:hypothetical protein